MISNDTISCDKLITHSIKENITVESTTTTKYRGGITCCDPLCNNNSLKNKNLSFYIIPKESNLRKKWLSLISRKNFVPSTSHRVCSVHFTGGKKTYMNNCPSLLSKQVKDNIKKTRITVNSSIGYKRKIDEIENEKNDVNFSFEETEPEKLKKEIIILKDKLNIIKTKKKEMKNIIMNQNHTINQLKFTVDRFKHNQAHFKFYTGFESYNLFKVLLEYLEPAASKLIYWGSNTNIEKTTDFNYNKKGRGRIMSSKSELFLVLTRFRMLPIWATKQTVKETMPKCFIEKYESTRVILDCTELFIEMPTSFRSQSATFSNYKHKNTAKGLIGIAPNGAITFVSDLYCGRFSDKQITKDCGIYNLLEPGDSVMADRGFDIADDLPENVSLNIPPFLNGKAQLSLEDENETRKIAAVRIHVERAIQRIKNYHILQTPFKLSMAPEINKTWMVCCYLANFLPQLVSDK